MRIKIKLDSAAASAKLRQWGGELREKVRNAVGTALRAEAPAIKAEVQSHVATKLKVVRRSFARSFTAKVIDRDTRRLPALHLGSRIPWIGIHESGGTIQGKLLIPLYGRVGRKAFKAHVTALMRGGNAYFIRNSRGNLVLMAENQREYDRTLARYKRRHRRATGSGRLKRGADVPIAVLVPRVTIRKRLDVYGVIAARVPAMSATIEGELGRLG
jgi:hypothetical protein